MSNIYRINGDKLYRISDILDLVNQREDVKHLVIMTTDDKDVTDIYYDRQSLMELSLLARQFSIHIDQLVAMTLEPPDTTELEY